MEARIQLAEETEAVATAHAAARAAVLAAAEAAAAVFHVAEGMAVVLTGLKKEEMNGLHGVCGALGENGRFSVTLNGTSKVVALRPVNLTPAAPGPALAAPSASSIAGAGAAPAPAPAPAAVVDGDGGNMHSGTPGDACASDSAATPSSTSAEQSRSPSFTATLSATLLKPSSNAAQGEVENDEAQRTVENTISVGADGTEMHAPTAADDGSVTSALTASEMCAKTAYLAAIAAAAEAAGPSPGPSPDRAHEEETLAAESDGVASSTAAGTLELPEHLQEGSDVMLHGLSREDMNGVFGTCGAMNPANGRVTVLIGHEGKTVALKPSNLRPVNNPPPIVFSYSGVFITFVVHLGYELVVGRTLRPLLTLTVTNEHPYGRRKKGCAFHSDYFHSLGGKASANMYLGYRRHTFQAD